MTSEHKSALERLIEMGADGSGPVAMTIHVDGKTTVEDLQAAADARARAVAALSGGEVMNEP